MKLFPSLKHPCLLGSISILSAIGLYHAPAYAEGSKDMVENGGDRPYTEWAGGTTAGIDRQTLLQVYVEAGETVYFGSSAPSSDNDPDDIVYRSPGGGQDGSCDVESTGFGLIDTVAKESAGPQPLDANGYEPCSFVATETGIYEFEMRAPATGGNPPGNQVAGDPFVTDGTQKSAVSAWDITVVDDTGTLQEGRVFTKYVALNMGSNNGSPNLRSEFFIQTRDGYLYRTRMRDVDPYGFVFFSNNRGYLDTDGSTLYRSVTAPDNNLDPFDGGVTVQPIDDANPNNITHLVFFNPPDTETLVELGIPTTPPVPAKPTNFRFVGNGGQSGNQTEEDAGGFFVFDTTSQGSYQIIIDTNSPSDVPSNGDFNPDGTFDPSVDTVLENPATVGTNVITWDGKDNQGNTIPEKTGPYQARIVLRLGEYHFPLLDAENALNGITIELLNAPGPYPTAFKDINGNNIDRFTIYYNDEDYTTADNTDVDLTDTGATSPRNASQGIDSRLGEHEFSDGYGDFKGIDTWTFFPSEPTSGELVITSTLQANVEGTKSAQFSNDGDDNNQVTVGDEITYTITYSNLNADTEAKQFQIEEALPSQLTYKAGSANIVSKTAGNAITLNPNYDGSTDTQLTQPETLRVGDTITIELTATINSPNGGNPITNQGSATFATDENGEGTVVTDADSNGGTSQSPNVGDSFSQTTDNGNEEGNDPSDTADDDPTAITVVEKPPQVLLVKRITQVNGSDVTGFDNNDGDTSDDHPDWPTPKSTFLRGSVSEDVKPGDILEYTIYYLSSGGQEARNFTICDLVPENQAFVRDAFNDEGVATNLGIAALIRENPLNDPPTPNEFLTNTDSPEDQGAFFPAGSNPPGECKKEDPPGSGTFTSLTSGDNINGLVVIDVVENAAVIPPAISPGTPPESYGFIRFRTKVE